MAEQPQRADQIGQRERTAASPITPARQPDQRDHEQAAQNSDRDGDPDQDLLVLAVRPSGEARAQAPPTASRAAPAAGRRALRCRPSCAGVLRRFMVD